MHNYVNGRPTESQRGSNEGVIHDALENDAYSAWFPAQILEDGLIGVATYTIGASYQEPSKWVIASGASAGVIGQVRRHAEWKDGFFKIKVYYSVSATGGDVYWSYGVGRFKEGIDFAVTLQNEAVAAPVSSKGVYVQEFNNTTLSEGSAIDMSHLMVQVVVARLGGDVLDTNAGDVNIYGVELIYQEKRRMVGGMHR